jgi:single-strand DNA-binding protein
MLNEAQISLTGYVATQPLAKTLKNGVTTVSMRVAWTPRRQDRITGEWVDGQTSYVTVNCWRRLATNVAICVRKGDPVAIQGRVSVRPFQDKEGRQRIAVEIEANSVAHDLNQGVSQFSRIRPQTGMTASEFAASRDAAGDGNASASGNAGGDGTGADGNGNGSGTGRFGRDRQAPHNTADGGDAAADSAALAAVGSWADGGNGIPMPDEPAFFDGSPTSEESVTGADTEPAPEALAS